MGGITSVAFMNGLMLGRLNDALKIEVSSLQLHNSKFMENDEVKYTINNTTEIINSISRNPKVEAISKRLKTEAMISSNRAAAGTVVIGINPEDEKKVSELYKHLVDSNSLYFEGIKRRPILIGHKMAEKLKVHLRSKVAISFVDLNGVSVREVFRIVGIYKTQNTGFDGMNVFIRFDDAKRMLGFKADESHEIAILLKEMMQTDEFSLSLKNKYTKFSINNSSLLKLRNDSIPKEIFAKLETIKSDKIYNYSEFQKKMNTELGEDEFTQYKKQIDAVSEQGLSIREWKQISPELAMQSTWLDFMVYVFVGIILAALGFGIVNTMLMVVLERIREIGMLIAIGMNRKRVFSMIILESVMLSLTGGIAGIILGWLIVTSLNTSGVDMSVFSKGMQALGYPSLIYPTVSFANYVQITIMVILTGILSAIYPALHAIKLKPAEAIRKE
jgi:ABC-type lipoprotein release transport system permease subunit